MAPSAEPLFTRPESEHSQEHEEEEEEEALLTGQRQARERSKWRTWTQVGTFVWAAVATIVLIVLAVLYQRSRSAGESADGDPASTGKRNLIFMVSDGMGPTSLSLTRSYRQYQYALPWDDALNIDGYLIGQSRTRSTSSLVTDSAAGATAFSCGMKSYNGAIATLPDHTPCGTVLEAAKRAGYMTGLVVTTRITDATPAVFASHVNRREEEDRIAEQMVGYYPLGQTVDLMLGAGRCHFLPNTTKGSCRRDDKDVVAMAEEKGYNYISKRDEFDGLGTNAKLPLLGLFADLDIPYEVDRQSMTDVYPSLAEMTQLALDTLTAYTRDSEKGFFLMVEGSRIDHAGHANDPVAQVHEVLAYDKAFSAVLRYLSEAETEGVLVSTSDHETGGLATARQVRPTYPEYHWFPGVLANASTSAERLSDDYLKQTVREKFSGKDMEGQKIDLRSWLRDIIAEGLGLHDVSDAEIEDLIERPEYSPYIFAEIVSRRSQTGWTTHGHSGADVNIYSSDAAKTKALVGNHENTEIGIFLREYLDVDVDAITHELREAARLGAFDMGALPLEGERLDGQDHLDHYQGDWKKYKRSRLGWS